jgi:PAS domain S-box-containing protein
VCIFWGDEYTLVYNKGYADIIGEKHPRVMGRPFSENFQSVWPVYEQIFREIKESGQSVKQEKLIRMLVRDGCLEEVFFNFILAPILGADGSAAGISLRIHETTQQVVFERRLHVLTSVNKAMATTYNLHDLCAAAAGVLHDSTSDIHFAAIYSTDMKDHSLHLVLEGTAGLKEGYDGIPPKDDPQVPQFGLNQALLHAFETREPKVLSTANNSLTQSTLSQLEEYGVQTPCQELVIQPLKCYIEDSIAAVIVVGTSPLRKFDEDYRTFLQLMTRQIENGISVVRGIEREKLLHKAKITSEIEGRFWRFAEKAPVGMYMYNPDDVLTFSNSAFELMVGRSGEELARPMAWLDTVHPDSVADVMKVWKKYRQSNCDEAISFEIQFKKPWTSPAGGAAGSLDRTWALGTVHPEYTEDGKLKGTLGCITDISSVKWAEKIQTTRLSEAIEQKRQQENFLDVTSHEMSMLSTHECM